MPYHLKALNPVRQDNLAQTALTLAHIAALSHDTLGIVAAYHGVIPLTRAA
jgi:hypothetical protein